MFGAFERMFRHDGDKAETGSAPSASLFADSQLSQLMVRFGGRSFNGGIYRIISSSKVANWDDLMGTVFPEFSGRITCFALDWLGRVFALDSARLVDNRFGVVMFEPGTGQVLDIPCDLVGFHDDELIKHKEEALAESFYQKWLAKGGTSPNVTQCVGYKKPLFLGGADNVGNLELSDLDVYWAIVGQLIQKTRGLSPGTAIGKVKVAAE